MPIQRQGSTGADAFPGDALVQVVRPPDASGEPFRVRVGDRDVTGAFGNDGVGLIDGLENGPNVVTATLDDGRGARITITNHPIGGPVFAGAQVQPWICQAGAKDAQCNRPTVVSYQYKDASSGSFEAYDPKNPPAASQHRDDDDRPGQEGPVHRPQGGRRAGPRRLRDRRARRPAPGTASC